jgi:hypothetical protein
MQLESLNQSTASEEGKGGHYYYDPALDEMVYSEKPQDQDESETQLEHGRDGPEGMDSEEDDDESSDDDEESDQEMIGPSLPTTTYTMYNDPTTHDGNDNDDGEEDGEDGSEVVIGPTLPTVAYTMYSMPEGVNGTKHTSSDGGMGQSHNHLSSLLGDYGDVDDDDEKEEEEETEEKGPGYSPSVAYQYQTAVATTSSHHLPTSIAPIASTNQLPSRQTVLKETTSTPNKPLKVVRTDPALTAFIPHSIKTKRTNATILNQPRQLEPTINQGATNLSVHNASPATTNDKDPGNLNSVEYAYQRFLDEINQING